MLLSTIGELMYCPQNQGIKEHLGEGTVYMGEQWNQVSGVQGDCNIFHSEIEQTRGPEGLGQ